MKLNPKIHSDLIEWKQFCLQLHNIGAIRDLAMFKNSAANTESSPIKHLCETNKKDFYGLDATLVAQPTSKCLTFKTLTNIELKLHKNYKKNTCMMHTIVSHIQAMEQFIWTLINNLQSNDIYSVLSSNNWHRQFFCDFRNSMPNKEHGDSSCLPIITIFIVPNAKAQSELSHNGHI